MDLQTAFCRGVLSQLRAAATVPHAMRAMLPVLAAGMSLSLGGCASDRAVINQANQVHDGLKPAVLEDPQLTSYLQQVGDRIIAAARDLAAEDYGPESHRLEDSSWMFSKNVRFHFVNSDTVNAFTTGGEHMYIYSELFQKCRTEDELAAVMAHEYAHIYARHVHKGMNRQYAIIGGALAAGAAGYAIGGEDQGLQYGAAFGTAALAAGQFVGSGFTRKDEDEADDLGFAFYTRAGWDPQKFGDFFQQMIDMGYDKTPEILSDHPSLANRVEASKRRAAELPPEAKSWRRPPVANAAKFKQLQARAAELAKTLPNDQTLAGAQKLLAAFANCYAPGHNPKQQQAREEIYGCDDANQQQQNQQTSQSKPRRRNASRQAQR